MIFTVAWIIKEQVKGPEYWLGLELSLTAAFWNSYNLEQYVSLVAHLRLPSFRR